MTPMIRAGFLGLALALSLAACKRREEAPAAPVKADTSAISFQKIDTTAGPGCTCRTRPTTTARSSTAPSAASRLRSASAAAW